MSTDHLRNSTYLHSSGQGNFRDERRGLHAGTPSIGNTDKIRQSVQTLLGDNVALTANKSVDLDRVYGSAAHNSLGLQVAISGRADVVQSDVAAHLGEYQGKHLSLSSVAQSALSNRIPFAAQTPSSRSSALQWPMRRA